MRKSQITFFFILGILVIISIGFLTFLTLQNRQITYSSEARKIFTFSDVKTDADRYITDCIKDSVTTSIQDTGIREDTLEKYESLIKTKVNLCVYSILASLREQKYDVNEGALSVNVIPNPDTIQVEIIYPITIQKDDQKIDLKEFHYTFDRAKTIRIPGGVTDKEINLVSANGKATLRIPEGVKITDKNGKPVENIGIRIEDLHFDGLQNRYVLGQLLYNNFPEGVQFSEPVELSIDFRDKDIPPGYTEKNIKIGYWNKEAGLWYAYPTEIRGNKAITNITHFSLFGTLVGRMIILVSHYFNQRYSPTGAMPKQNINNDDLAKKLGIWVIGDNSETVSLQPNSDLTAEKFVSPGVPSSLEEFSNIEEAGYVDQALYEVQSTGSVDFQDLYTDMKGDFINPPKIQYGFFLHPETPSDAEFINCQPEDGAKKTSTNIIFQTGRNGAGSDDNPYFCIRTTRSRYNIECTTCTKEGYGDYYKVACNGFPNGMVLTEKGDTSLQCIPYFDRLEGRTVPCCAEPYVPIQSAKVAGMPTDSQTCAEAEGYNYPVFGLFNRKCTGGIVRPEGGEAADFIALAPEGNGILAATNVLTYQLSNLFEIPIDTPLISVYAKPPTNWLDFQLVLNLDYAAGDINHGRDRDEELYTYYSNKIDQKGLGINYYCDIQPFPGTAVPSYQAITLSDAARQSAITRMKTDLGFDVRQNAVIPAFGIYGLNIFLKEDAAKDDIHTQCWTYWMFWGNGYVANAPTYLRQEYDELGDFKAKPTDLIKILAVIAPDYVSTYDNMKRMEELINKAINGDSLAQQTLSAIFAEWDLGDIFSTK